jgi:hypothetical protein
MRRHLAHGLVGRIRCSGTRAVELARKLVEHEHGNDHAKDCARDERDSARVRWPQHLLSDINLDTRGEFGACPQIPVHKFPRVHKFPSTFPSESSCSNDSSPPDCPGRAGSPCRGDAVRGPRFGLPRCRRCSVTPVWSAVQYGLRFPRPSTASVAEELHTWSRYSGQSQGGPSGSPYIVQNMSFVRLLQLLRLKLEPS